MDLDPVFLARLQFAITIGFHFIFPPISIGLAWLLVIVEWMGWKKNSDVYRRAGIFFGKMFALTFVIGVATGIVMEFQFGTNWAEYSKFVGDIFGAPLAAEGIFAFFLESTFLGLYLLGRNRVSKGVHWFSILMVAVGATISAFWILVANSWQQTPAGFILQNGRAELADFWQAVFNPSTLLRFFHTMLAALITGSFFMAGISSWLILKKKGVDFASRTLKIAIIAGLIFSVLELFPFGHEHIKQVARTQPEKFASFEGLFIGQSNAPLLIFGLPKTNPPEIVAEIKIPGLLSYLLHGNVDAHVRGLNEFPADEIPPLWLTFVSFHNMIALGMYFIFITALGAFFIYRKNLLGKRWFLKILIFSIPLPVAACQFGWVATEVGRQPWVVYKLLKTAQAVSITVTAGEILFSIILFSIIYLFLFVLYIYLSFREVNHVPDDHPVAEARS